MAVHTPVIFCFPRLRAGRSRSRRLQGTMAHGVLLASVLLLGVTVTRGYSVATTRSGGTLAHDSMELTDEDDNDADMDMEQTDSRNPNWRDEKLLIPRVLVGGGDNNCDRMEQWDHVWKTYVPLALQGVALPQTRFVWNVPEFLDELKKAELEVHFNGRAPTPMLPSATHYSKRCLMKMGTLFVPSDDHMDDLFPGTFIVGSGFLPRMPSHSKIEVMRFWRADQYRNPEDEATLDQIWYYHAPGSGIYLDIGVALWSTPTLRMDSSPYSCKDVQGQYDTIIFQKIQPDPAKSEDRVRYGGIVELVDCRGDGKGFNSSRSTVADRHFPQIPLPSADELTRLSGLYDNSTAAADDADDDGNEVEPMDANPHPTERPPRRNRTMCEWDVNFYIRTGRKVQANLPADKYADCVSVRPWESACPPAETSRFLSMLHDGNSHPCVCNGRYSYLNCFGKATPPSSLPPHLRLTMPDFIPRQIVSMKFKA